MKFLVDNQLPAALARSIAARGHEGSHVLDVGVAAGNRTAESSRPRATHPLAGWGCIPGPRSIYENLTSGPGELTLCWRTRSTEPITEVLALPGFCEAT